MTGYRSAKKSNNTTGNNPHSSICYDDVDSVLGCRDQITLPEVKEAGLDDEEGIEGESDAYIKSLNDKKVENLENLPKPEKKSKVRQKDDVVERQLEAFAASEERHYKFMKEMMEAQAKREEKEKENDKDFFLKLASIFK